MNCLSGSTSVTFRSGSCSFRYFAQVAPPNPPPTMTTCARFKSFFAPVSACSESGRPSAAPAPVMRRKSLRVNFFTRPPLFFLAGDVGRQRLDFGVAVTLGLATHDGGEQIVALKLFKPARELGGAQIGEARNASGAASVGSVAGKAI